MNLANNVSIRRANTQRPLDLIEGFDCPFLANKGISNTSMKLIPMSVSATMNFHDQIVSISAVHLKKRSSSHMLVRSELIV